MCPQSFLTKLEEDRNRDTWPHKWNRKTVVLHFKMHTDSPVQFGVFLRVQTPKGLGGGFSGWLLFRLLFQYTYIVLTKFYFSQRCIHQCCKQAHADRKRTDRSVSSVSMPSVSFLLICSQSCWDYGVLLVRLFIYLPAPIHTPPSPHVDPLLLGWVPPKPGSESKEFQKGGNA